MTRQRNIRRALAAIESADGLLSSGKKTPAKKKTARRDTSVKNKPKELPNPKGGSLKTAPDASKKRPSQKKGKKDAANKRKSNASTVTSAMLSDEARDYLAKYRAEKSYSSLSASQKKIVTAFGNAPNLKSMNRVIQRGSISAEEVVAAVQEALKIKRMSPRLADMIGEALMDVFGVGDVIDVGVAASVISAGYSHYYTLTDEINDEQWEKILKGAAKIFRAAKRKGIDIAGTFGNGKPELTDTRLSFNGKGMEGLESLSISRIGAYGGSTEAVKTGQRPYDAVVVSVLALIKKIAPKAISIDSDSNDPNLFKKPPFKA